MILDPRSFLATPALYRLFVNLISGPYARARVVNEFLRVKPGDSVLDVGCGSAEILSYIPDTDYCGVDISPEYIAAARSKYGNRGRFAIRAVAENTSFADLGKFNLVVAMGLIHHLNDSEAASLFSAAKAALKPGGRFVTLDNVFVPDQTTISRWIIRFDRGNHVRAKDEYFALANSHFESVSVKVFHDLLRIPHTHIVMDCF